MNKSALQSSLQAGPPECALGVCSPDLGRVIGALFARKSNDYTYNNTTPGEAWSSFLSLRPSLLLIEIGNQHSLRAQRWLRSFLCDVRERSSASTFVAVVLTSPEKFYFGGDLLFDGEESLSPSSLVDTFLVCAPGNVPSMPTIAEQALQLVELLSTVDVSKRLHLNSPGWAQSMSDQSSQELWMRWVPRFASYTNENPLLLGETGTGKTNLAKALHHFSNRSGAFVSVTPRDFSSSELVQAELFGAVAGAYTGAVDKWGLVKQAEGGTLFIDELQSIDKDLQGKLITFIENKRYRRVGSAESIAADVRFVFASNVSLQDMMSADILRHDFAYRLERMQLELLPLRERRLDIPAALAYSLAKVHRQRPRPHTIEGIQRDAFSTIFSFEWPGNLRQLENRIAQLCEYADMRLQSLISEQTIEEAFRGRMDGLVADAHAVLARSASGMSQKMLSAPHVNLSKGIETFVELARGHALESSGGSCEQAAQLLGDEVETLQLFAVRHAAHRKATLAEPNEE